MRKFLEKIFRPDSVQLLQRANALYVQQDYAKAKRIYNKILRQNPQHLAALCNRANIFLFEKKYADALVDSNLAIKVAPHLAAGYSLRGRVHLEHENFADAIADLRQAVNLDSKDFWNYNYLSQALQKNAQYQEALKAAWQAVELSGGAESQHLNLAYTIYEISLENQGDSFKGVLQKWYQKYTPNPIVEQSYKSFFADDSFAKSHEDYVKKLFDNYAESFDESLALLEYDSPQKITRLIAQNMRIDKNKIYQILDLGCGTGLCAKGLDSLFKKRQMTGVDLSVKMLEQAAAKKCYKTLIEADIEAYLQGQKEAFDVVACADVLTYFGALDNVFLGVAQALKSQGLFAFSISQNIDNNKEWFLHASSRFVHSKIYVENSLKKSGFHLLKLEDSVLRKEGEKDVCGWVVLAAKKV